MKLKKGRLIVICGTDGSGKATQTNILANKLKKSGYSVKITDFPQYGKRSAAMVEDYLNGKFGSAEEVGPYRASVFYAVDRFAASRKMYEWLSQGKIIISNRYVSANQGHQGGKIREKKEMKRFLRWLNELEYNIFLIPRPSVNIFLYVPYQIGQKLVLKKKHREYIKGSKRDIHEKNIQHLKDAERAYLYMAKHDKSWIKIDCTKKGKILSKKEISDKVWDAVQKIIRK
ncbi:thymidylate kinase [Candidatus Woesearchaeota archaeon]|nr:thymidylate kinase [Candidatus Woesearchaeota archaeon]